VGNYKDVTVVRQVAGGIDGCVVGRLGSLDPQACHSGELSFGANPGILVFFQIF